MGLLNWFINPNDALRRRVERAFLLKDSESNRRLMREMNNEAEKKEKNVKKKGKVGLKEENKLKVGENLEEGERTKEKMAMTVEKNKLKCAHKGDVARFGLEVETEGANTKTIGGLVPGSEQLSKKTLSWVGSKASARSRSGPWEVNRELTSRTGKLDQTGKEERGSTLEQVLAEELYRPHRKGDFFISSNL